jgi:hypothetical protein
MLEMLAQGEKAVESVAAEVGIDVKLASAHLKALKEARLVQSRREGKRMVYRLSGKDVAHLGVTLREVSLFTLFDVPLIKIGDGRCWCNMGSRLRSHGFGFRDQNGSSFGSIVPRSGARAVGVWYGGRCSS